MNVLVLGGGFGGVATANRLRRILPSSSRIAVIERSPRFVFQPSLLWVVSGDRSPDDIHRASSEVLDRGVELLRGEILAIDPRARRVETDSGSRTADALVISLGVTLDLSAIPGFRTGAMNLYGFDGAVSARRRLQVLDRGHIVFFVATKDFKCPTAPYEAALLLDASLRQRGVRSRVAITLVTPEPRPLPGLPADIGEQVERLLTGRDIDFLPKTVVSRVDSSGGTLFFEGGGRADADVLIGVPPQHCPPVLEQSGLAAKDGWVKVHRETLNTEFDRVYAIGDCVEIPIGTERVLPKAGVFADAQAQVVAGQIEAVRSSGHSQRRFLGRGACFLEVGNGRAGLVDGDFFATPEPQAVFRRPRPWWHWSKVWLEKTWLKRYF